MNGGMWIVHLALFLLLVKAGSAALDCYVCTNAKNVKVLYNSDCYKNPNKMEKVTDAANPKAGVWNCDNYVTLIGNAILKYREAIGKGSGRQNDSSTVFPEGECTKGYNLCRSFYYEANFDYKSDDGKSLGTLSGSNERVFRYCGCEDPSEKELGCKDYKQGSIRKRYCQCKPGSSGNNACNSASAFKKDIFAALLLATAAILGLSVRHV